MSIQFGIALGIIIVLGIAIAIGNRKKKWYKINKATNGLEEMLCVYRTQGDYFFGEHIKGFITAHYADGTTVYIPQRWVLLVTRVSENKVDSVLNEVEIFNNNQKTS